MGEGGKKGGKEGVRRRGIPSNFGPVMLTKHALTVW